MHLLWLHIVGYVVQEFHLDHAWVNRIFRILQVNIAFIISITLIVVFRSIKWRFLLMHVFSTVFNLVYEASIITKTDFIKGTCALVQLLKLNLLRLTVLCSEWVSFYVSSKWISFCFNCEWVGFTQVLLRILVIWLVLDVIYLRGLLLDWVDKLWNILHLCHVFVDFDQVRDYLRLYICRDRLRILTINF